MIHAEGRKKAAGCFAQPAARKKMYDMNRLHADMKGSFNVRHLYITIERGSVQLLSNLFQSIMLSAGTPYA